MAKICVEKPLAGQRVLLVMPKFFGYEKDIRSEMERQGAIVDWLPDRPFDSSILKSVAKLRPDYLLPFTDVYYQKVLEDLGTPKYNKIFVINGQTISYKFLQMLRISNPSAQLILYMWDSIKNRPNILKNLSLFDKVFSFDAGSAREFGFRHRPLFFSPGFKPSLNTDFSFHMSFIGTAHSDRYEVIKKVKDSLPVGLNNFWYLYLQAKWVYYAYKLTQPNFQHAKIDEFNFEPLNKKIVQLNFSESFAILDIEHPNQTGLTMRTLEAFGSHKKIVTTNEGIKEYDFFNSSNICVIDRKNPKIPSSFFNEEFIPPSSNLYESYSLHGWLAEILY